MAFLGWLIRLVFFGLVLWFAVKNTTPVPLRFSEALSFPAVPLIVVILGSFTLGVLAAAAALAPRLTRQRRQAAAAQATAAQHDRASVEAGQDSYGDRLARAARNAGAAGQLDPDTRLPRD